MAFEPFGLGDRWYDRIGGRNLKPGCWALLLPLAALVAAALMQFS
jgi:hypothetical protein